jgi:tRNA A-37 threonylcarbamoyl transferase component Bud32
MDDGRDATVPGTIMAPPTDVDGEPAGRDSVSRVSGDRYRVINRLGKGGMGEVMTVRDETIGREVALKRIRKADPSDRLVQRFLREASIQGRLEHPAVVPVYDLGIDATGMPFFTMRKLAGTTLAKILDGDRTGYSLQRLLRAFAEVCLAVEFAHVRGIIHRDLKPENIVLGDFGEVYVLDWGVAKVLGEPEGEFADMSSSGESGEYVTMPGTAIGTPGYMAPEQVRGVIDVDGRADVYALGCVLFEILANTMLHPKGKPGLSSAIAGIDARPSLRSPERVVPPELDEMCVLATDVDRERRIATARALGDRVQRFLDGDRDVATRKQLAQDHLDAARAAFAAGDADDLRRRAMREAASALALDPALVGAAELVGRLMLEPPRITPRDVEEAIRADDTTTTKGNARVGVWAYLSFLAFMPLVWWMAPPDSTYLIAVPAMVLVNLAVCWWGTRTPRTAGREGILAITNAVLVAIVARMFTPFLIAPALAAMSAMAFLFTPTRSRITTFAGMAVLSSLAVLGPWLAERAGLLSVTTTIDSRGILLHAAAVSGDENRTLAVAALYVVATICAAAGMANGMRVRERAAKRHLHLQAWQLRQLVPR